MIKDRIEEILFTHILIGNVHVEDFTIEKHEEVIRIRYNDSCLLRIFIPKDFFKAGRMISHSSELKLPGRTFFKNEEELLKDIRKVNTILCNWIY